MLTALACIWLTITLFIWAVFYVGARNDRCHADAANDGGAR